MLLRDVNAQKTRWQQGRVVEQMSSRSYLVANDQTQETVRRNRVDLREMGESLQPSSSSPQPLPTNAADGTTDTIQPQSSTREDQIPSRPTQPESTEASKPGSSKKSNAMTKALRTKSKTINLPPSNTPQLRRTIVPVPQSPSSNGNATATSGSTESSSEVRSGSRIIRKPKTEPDMVYY